MTTSIENAIASLQSQIDTLNRILEAAGTMESHSFSLVAVVDGIIAPGTASGWALIYVDASDGDLKVKFGDGTIKTIATDT